MKKIRTTNHKITAALLVAVMMLSVIFTEVLFSGGVKAKAAQDVTLDGCTGSPVSSEDGFFTITKVGNKNLDNSFYLNGKKYEHGLKYAKGSAISFNAPQAGVLTIVCQGAKTTSAFKINSSAPYVLGTEVKVISVKIEAGENKIERSSGESWIYYVIYAPGQTALTNSYNVTVNDSAKSDASEKTITGIYTEGATLTLSATGDNFAYWKNSKDVIVGRDKIVNMPVYYGETYTAVYNTEHKVNYLTAYEQVLYSYSKSEFTSISVPGGPVRYGYAFTGWDKSYDYIVNALDNDDVYVRPIYESADGEEYNYEITVNTEKFGGSSVTKSYRVNEVVTATVSSDNFAYWKDETGKIVSYSPTYLFFANKATTVTAFAGPAGKEDDAKAVITKVSSENEKASDGSPVVIFEYNIPAGYHIDFAGVLASKTLSGESLTVENGAYVIGDSDLSYTTYRYTLTSKAGVTWNVKPMLKYTYNGITHTIYGDEIILK